MMADEPYSFSGEEESMDSAAAAKKLGTDPRTLRQFLRSPYSNFQPVGSGSRYEFRPGDLPTLQKEFDYWTKRDRKKLKRITEETSSHNYQTDEEVWKEEESAGEVPVLENINDPAVREKVRWVAQEQIRALHQRMLEKGIVPGLRNPH